MFKSDCDEGPTKESRLIASDCDEGPTKESRLIASDCDEAGREFDLPRHSHYSGVIPMYGL